MRISGSIVYEEKHIFWFILLIMLPLIAIFLAILIYQILIGPLGTKPAPNWFLALMLFIFILLDYGFLVYRVIITTEVLIAGFPLYSVKIPWEKVADVEEMKGSVWKYGGYGIRIGKMNGKSVMLIVIPRISRILLKMHGWKRDYLVVSIGDKDTAINYIRQEIEIHRTFQ